MGAEQLPLFEDERDAILEQALKDLSEQQSWWYKDPVHRSINGPGLHAFLRQRGIEIDLGYCIQWAERSRSGWNQRPFWLNCLICNGQQEACQCCWLYYQQQGANQKDGFEDKYDNHPGTPCVPLHLRIPYPDRESQRKKRKKL